MSKAVTVMSDVEDLVVRIDDVSRSVIVDGAPVVLLSPISLELRASTLVVVAGPSGSGKTTLCNIVIGWEHSDTGAVRWSDRDADDAGGTGDADWGRLAVVPQRLALIESLSLGENLRLPFWSQRRAVPEPEIARVCAQLEVADLLLQHPSQVSFGEQQRIAIARAVVGRPRLAVIDEPTGHQDEARAGLVISQLLEARAAGSCLLVATHDAEVIAAADVVVHLR
jgi:ABC-type lipoprotein export system ATPase subunit